MFRGSLALVNPRVQASPAWLKLPAAAPRPPHLKGEECLLQRVAAPAAKELGAKQLAAGGLEHQLLGSFPQLDLPGFRPAAQVRHRVAQQALCMALQLRRHLNGRVEGGGRDGV